MRVCICLFVDRIPEAGVNRDWPENIYFTFQFYRFPPVTSQQLRLLTSDKGQPKADSPLPCLLASISRDGTVNSGKHPTRCPFPPGKWPVCRYNWFTVHNWTALQRLHWMQSSGHMTRTCWELDKDVISSSASGDAKNVISYVISFLAFISLLAFTGKDDTVS